MNFSVTTGLEKVGEVYKKEMHTVHIVVQVSEKEKTAAKAASILDRVIYSTQWDPKTRLAFNVTLRDLAEDSGRTETVDDFQAASRFANLVKDSLSGIENELRAAMGESEEDFKL